MMYQLSDEMYLCGHCGRDCDEHMPAAPYKCLFGPGHWTRGSLNSKRIVAASRAWGQPSVTWNYSVKPQWTVK